MMRKIEQRIVKAIQDKTEFKTPHDSVYHYADGGWAVDLLGTKVVLVTPKTKWNPLTIVLRTGGYKSATTKSRMNAVLPQIVPGLLVWQESREWFICGLGGKPVPFVGNTMVLCKVRGKWKAEPAVG